MLGQYRRLAIRLALGGIDGLFGQQPGRLVDRVDGDGGERRDGDDEGEGEDLMGQSHLEDLGSARPIVAPPGEQRHNAV